MYFYLRDYWNYDCIQFSNWSAKDHLPTYELPTCTCDKSENQIHCISYTCVNRIHYEREKNIMYVPLMLIHTMVGTLMKKLPFWEVCTRSGINIVLFIIRFRVFRKYEYAMVMHVVRHAGLSFTENWKKHRCQL